MTIDFVPIEFYTPLYYHILLVAVLLTFLHCQVKIFTVVDTKTVRFSLGGFLLFWFVLLYIGLRPIDGIFVDMTIYAYAFERAMDKDYVYLGDALFDYFEILCSKIMTVENFFLACATAYVVPLYIVSKKWFNQYWFYVFLMLVGSFSFWAYGTNGIRNGMATSLFLLAVSREKRIYQILWLVISIGFHSSMILPTLGFVITWIYNKPTAFFKFWFLSIPFSLLLPGFWENTLAVFLENDKAALYLTDDSYADSFSSTGFRWDFLLYSATGVFAGWYYLFKKRFKDSLYNQLFNTFLFANAFWILVIRASFSNRFAYLSWFMLALVIIYPWLKEQFIQNQTKKMGLIILAYFVFTYVMNVILIKQ